MKKTDKILEYIIYLLVFILPWQTRWIIKPGELSGGYWEYGTISLYVFDVLLLFGLFLSIWAKKNNEKIKNIWFYFLFSTIVLLSVFWSENKVLSLFYCFRIIMAVGFYWLLGKSIYNRLNLIMFFLSGAVAQAGLGIWQFLEQKTFASKYLGMAWHGAETLGASVVETAAGERWLRAYGGLDHPNILGGFLAVAAIIAIILLISEGIKSGMKIYLLSCYLIYLAGIFFSFSRTAWAGMVIGIILLLVYCVAAKKYKCQEQILYIILISSAMLFILGGLFSNLVAARVSNNARLEIKSSQERMVGYIESRELIKKNWLFGAGAGHYGIKLSKNNPGYKAYYYQPIHNTWLLIFIELGIGGLLLFGTIFYKAINSANWVNKIYLFVIVIMMLGDHWWWSLHFGIFLIIISIYFSNTNLRNI